MQSRRRSFEMATSIRLGTVSPDFRILVFRQTLLPRPLNKGLTNITWYSRDIRDNHLKC
jgi:hypothetical protein